MPKEKAEYVDFKVIKQAVTLLQVLDRYGITATLKRSGDSLTGPCPIHGGSPESTHFRASIGKNCYNCFGECKGGGNVLDFVAKKEKVSVRQAALLIQQWFSVNSTPKPPQTANTAPAESNGTAQPKLEEMKAPVDAPQATPPAELKTKNEPLTFTLKNLDTANPYLTGRGMSPETISAFSLGLCSKGSMAGRIVIPIHNAEGQLVAYAGRWPGDLPEGTPKYRFPNGFLKSLEVFNLYSAAKENPSEPLIVVEGFFDCIWLWQAGFKRVVAVMGCSVSNEQALLIAKAAGPYGRVIVLFDEDEAGQKGREQAVLKLSPLVYVKSGYLGRSSVQPDMLSAAELAAVLK